MPDLDFKSTKPLTTLLVKIAGRPWAFPGGSGKQPFPSGKYRMSWWAIGNPAGAFEITVTGATMKPIQAEILPGETVDAGRKDIDIP